MKVFRYFKRKISECSEIAWKGLIVPWLRILKIDKRSYKKLNLCSGGTLLKGYWNVDVAPGADLIFDLSRDNLPFKDNSMSVVVCMSAINYFSRARAQEIIKETYRVLETGGVARFGVQDLQNIAQKYISRDVDFFFQRLPDGRERFVGETMADKINSWFYGYEAYGRRPCKYVYDFETLALLFEKAGFKKIAQRVYRESSIPEINLIDNRPDQMFFLEAMK